MNRVTSPWVALLWLVAYACPAVSAETLIAEDFDGTWREGRWTFSNGAEFPGARGRLERSAAAGPLASSRYPAGQSGGRLVFDFTGGGNYVAAILSLDKAADIVAARVWVKKPAGHRLTFRYTDPTGQTLQRGFEARDERWTDSFIPVSGWTGFWGGTNDGTPHGPPTHIAILVENTAKPQGELLFDDVRLILGKPTKGAGMVISDVVAARFAPGEGWRCHAAGPAGATKLDGRMWHFDFSAGASSIAIVPMDESLLGMPQEFRIRVRGAAPGHPVRLQLGSHFMTFEKTIGEFANAGENGLVVPAPPGEGWRWFGGENDGKIHGPLRIRGLCLDAAGRKDAGQLELLDIRVKTACEPPRSCVLTAECRGSGNDAAFVATVRSLAPKPIEAVVRHVLRDWAGATLSEGNTRVTLPANGEPLETRVALPRGEHRFLEAEFALEAEDQLTPPAQACYVAPIEPDPTAARGARSAALDPASPFGMGLYLYRYSLDPMSLKEMDRAAQMGQDAGVKWSREEFHWARIEPRKGELDWSFYDAMVATAKRHGISLYGILAYWSGWTKPYTPEGIEDYCRFAAAAVERYKADIQHWEVWNEPNIFFWQGPRDLYAELLKRAYATIKKANPKALVLGCSTAGIDEGFIKRTMDLGAPFDILTIHPYRGHLGDQAFIADLTRVADLARRPDGTHREVWITEMGWGTHVPHNAIGMDFRPTTERDQAKLLARAYIDAIASGVAPNISWYDFRNDGNDPLNFEYNMGIVTRDFRPKPAYRAYATLTAMLEGKRATKPLGLGRDVIGWEFAGEAGSEPIRVLWCIEANRTIELPSGRPIVMVDLMGERRALAPSGGKVSIALQRDTPVFLIEATAARQP